MRPETGGQGPGQRAPTSPEGLFSPMLNEFNAARPRTAAKGGGKQPGARAQESQENFQN
jgi:hypothetical protein